MDKRYRNIIVLLLVVHLAALILFAAFRLADADEGFFWAAAKMVNQGMSVYDDFFFVQMAMMPQLFAPLAGDGWETFYLLRGIAVLAGFLSIVFLTLIALKITNDKKSAILVVGLYCLSGLLIAFHSVYKIPVFCHLFSLATFYFWIEYYKKKRLIYLVLTGLFLSVLFNFRYLNLVLILPYALSIYYISNNRKLYNLLIFLISLIPVSLYTIVKYSENPGNFIFGNLLFHLNRHDNNSLLFILQDKLNTFYKILIDPQLFIIFILASLSIWILLHKRILSKLRNLVNTPEGMILTNLILLSVVYIIPNPMLRQYVEQYLAFAILLIGVNAIHMFDWFKSRIQLKLQRVLLTALSAIYVLAIVPYIVVFIYGVRDFDSRYRLSEIKKVSEFMIAQASPNDTVLTEWPGYHCITGQTPLRFTETQGYEYQNIDLPHSRWMEIKLGDGAYLNQSVMDRIPQLVVTINDTPEYLIEPLAEHYEMAYNSGDVYIYRQK